MSLKKLEKRFETMNEKEVRHALSLLLLDASVRVRISLSDLKDRGKIKEEKRIGLYKRIEAANEFSHTFAGYLLSSEDGLDFSASHLAMIVAEAEENGLIDLENFQMRAFENSI